MEEKQIKGTVRSWQGGDHSNNITLEIEESDAISLMDLPGHKVVVTLQ